MTEIIRIPEDGTEQLTVREFAELAEHARRQLAAMADMLRLTNERMAALEQAVRTLEKVTPAQASALNRAMRQRAAAVCREYLCEGKEKEAAAAIRRSVRAATGARSAREIPRCDYWTVLELITAWDDYEAMKAIRTKEGAKK